MAETTMPLEERDIALREIVLRSKKRSHTILLVTLVLASGMLLWFLQDMEKVGMTALLLVLAFVMALIGVGFFLLRKANRLVEQDLQATEKIAAPGVVVQSYNNVSANDRFISIETEGRLIHVPRRRLRRLMDDAVVADTLYPGIWLMLEYTLHGRELLRITRL